MDHHRPAVRLHLPDRRADREYAAGGRPRTHLQRDRRPAADVRLPPGIAVLPVRAEPDLGPLRQPARRNGGPPPGTRRPPTRGPPGAAAGLSFRPGGARPTPAPLAPPRSRARPPPPPR